MEVTAGVSLSPVILVVAISESVDGVGTVVL
jgi:hypothetical protein